MTETKRCRCVAYRYCGDHDRVEKARCGYESGHSGPHNWTDADDPELAPWMVWGQR